MGKLNLSRFDLSHEVKTTFELGKLIPIHWLDVVPGDKIRCKTSSLIRTHPLIAPIMHRLDYYVRYYYVPYRLLVDDYTKILSNPDDPREMPNLFDYLSKSALLDDGDDYPISFTNLLSYFGINSSTGKIPRDVLEEISALPFLAYQLIYNFYYRDPLLDPDYKDVFEPKDFDTLEDILRVQNVLWFQDYFTSSKTSTQFGTAVDIDLDGNNTVKVTELRLAEMLQKFKEKLLETGNKYIDFMKEFFGTYPRDFAVQRPLYLGGFSSNLNISDVDQMAPSSSDPLGNQAGKSLSVVGDDGYFLTPDEHGIVLGLAFVKPRQSYIKGVPRSFIKKDFYSFFNPLFSNIGMQPTYMTEIDASRSTTEIPFGYNERYAELKSIPDVVCGSFVDELQYWHFGRDIRKESLSKDFLTCNPTLSPFAYIGVNDVSSLHLYAYKVKFSHPDMDDVEEFHAAFVPKDKISSYIKYLKTLYLKVTEVTVRDISTDYTAVTYSDNNVLELQSVLDPPSYSESLNWIVLYSNKYKTLLNGYYTKVMDVVNNDTSFSVPYIILNTDRNGVRSLAADLQGKNLKKPLFWHSLDYVLRNKKEQILSVHYHDIDALRPLPKDPNILY